MRSRANGFAQGSDSHTKAQSQWASLENPILSGVHSTLLFNIYSALFVNTILRFEYNILDS